MSRMESLKSPAYEVIEVANIETDTVTVSFKVPAGEDNIRLGVTINELGIGNGVAEKRVENVAKALHWAYINGTQASLKVANALNDHLVAIKLVLDNPELSVGKQMLAIHHIMEGAKP